MDKVYKMLAAFCEVIPMKKRRDSRHWWRRIQSKKYYKTIIKKVVCIWFLSIGVYLFTALGIVPNDLLAVVWAILVVAIVIPDKSKQHKRAEKIARAEEKHWLTDSDFYYNVAIISKKNRGKEKVMVK